MQEGDLRIRGTTILAVRRDGRVAMAGDGQISYGQVVVKQRARKLRTLYNDTVLAGFAGAVADALALFDRFEVHLEKTSGQLRRAAVELAKEWRRDRYLRRLEASIVVADREYLLTIDGDGEVIEPDENVVAIGSGGPFAYAAALALYRATELSALEIARQAMDIAATLCVYTNKEISLLELPRPEASPSPPAASA